MTANTCLELALEGERLCKSCDFEGGINFFEAAINIGTTDKKTLSAIYSQIGNAYFYLSNYDKALHYHKLDLQLAKSMKDEIGEAKASGNLGNTMKMLSRFDEAAVYCGKHLEISRSLGDKVGEGRALYNLGNVYHTKGKHLASSSLQDPGDFPDDVKNCFRKAVDYYEKNLQLMIELGDKSAQGRAFGNLGNTHYLLGNFDQAVYYHTERLRIAREFNDKAAERRAHCNLGNAHIFLWDFDKAIYNFKQTLIIAQDLGDKVLEAQAYYSLGNTYTLLRDFKTAIDYHIKHLQLAQELSDQIGEGRAYWSLGNALSAIGNHQEALNYAYKHLDISKKIGDKTGFETAAKSITDLRNLLSEESQDVAGRTTSSSSSSRLNRNDKTPERPKSKRFSMENMNLLKLTPSNKSDSIMPSVSNNNLNAGATSSRSTINTNSSSHIEQEEDNFLDLLIRFQGKRMDDQRCSFDPVENKENCKPDKGKGPRTVKRPGQATLQRSISHPAQPAIDLSQHQHQSHSQQQSNGRRGSNPLIGESRRMAHSNSQSSSSAYGSTSSDLAHNELFDLIENMQSRRLEEQRAPPSLLKRSLTVNDSEHLPVTENHRNRHDPSHVERHNINSNHGINDNRRPSGPLPHRASLLPDDEFFDQLMRCQSSRLEDQRVALPSLFVSSGRVQQQPQGHHNRHSSVIDRPNGNRIRPSASAQSANSVTTVTAGASRGSTLPDEDFFGLIMRFQSARIEDQRSILPNHSKPENTNGSQHAHNRGPRNSSSTSSLSSRKSSVSESNDKKCTKV